MKHLSVSFLMPLMILSGSKTLSALRMGNSLVGRGGGFGRASVARLLSDGGGGFNGFKQMEQNRTNYLQRDAILDYCKMHQVKGKSLEVELPKRITK